MLYLLKIIDIRNVLGSSYLFFHLDKPFDGYYRDRNIPRLYFFPFFINGGKIKRGFHKNIQQKKGFSGSNRLKTTIPFSRIHSALFPSLIKSSSFTGTFGLNPSSFITAINFPMFFSSRYTTRSRSAVARSIPYKFTATPPPDFFLV